MRVVKELVKINECIEKLEKAGAQLWLHHQHNLEGLDFGGDPKMPISDFTEMEMDFRGYTYKGFAYCSAKDNFNPAVGSQKAFSRMMECFSDNYGRLFVKEMFE